MTGRIITLIAASSLWGCSAFFGNSAEETEPADAGPGVIVVDDVVLTTRVDMSTLVPEGPGGRTFSGATRLLYLCFRVVEVGPAGGVIVAWQRSGAEEPFSTTRLAVTGARRMVAAYEPLGTFEPGEYVVRILQEHQAVAEVPFEILGPPGGGEPPPTDDLSVSPLRFVAALDGAGRAAGRPMTVLPAGSREVHCVFDLSGAARDTRVEVTWHRSGRRLAASLLGAPDSGSRELVASFRPSGGLESGLYRVEVVVGGSAVRAGTFTVEQEAPAGGAGPRVSNLVLTTAADHRTGRPLGERLTTIRGDEPRLYLTFTFAGMPDDDTLAVRWFRRGAPDVLLAAATYAVAGRGAIAASFEPGAPLDPGSHRVEVFRQGSVLGTLSFTVDRPDDPSEEEPDGGTPGEP